ncbi:MAG: hypothetical protein HW384_688 [Dehalococcoidia bacterium]|nr:hypothetical protein [Dehalococcoidia bacterium]
MDPKTLTSLDWYNIRIIVQTLWLILTSVVVFGGAFLFAHVFLPGPVPFSRRAVPGQMKTVPPKNLRLVLYLLSGASLIFAIVITVRTFSILNSIITFYPRFWM